MLTLRYKDIPIYLVLIIIVYQIFVFHFEYSFALSLTTTIPVQNDPRYLAFDQDEKIYVTNHGSDTVSVINSTTDTVIKTINVGEDPYHLVYHPIQKKIYVANLNYSNFEKEFVSVIDTTTDTVVANIQVDNDPQFLLYNPDNGFIYVANQGSFGPPKVSVIDPEDDTIETTISLGLDGRGPTHMAYDNNNKKLFVGNLFSDTVSIIDTTSNSLITTIFGFPDPRFLVFDSLTIKYL